MNRLWGLVAILALGCGTERIDQDDTTTVLASVKSQVASSDIPRNLSSADVYDWFSYDYGRYNPDVANACGGIPDGCSGVCINGRPVSGFCPCRPNQYRDCQSSHFLFTGRAEGRRTSISYDGNYYYDTNTDLQAVFGADRVAFMNHYADQGRDEGRPGSRCDLPFFSSGYYINRYPDLQNAIGNDPFKLCQHWEQSGIAEGREAFLLFNVAAYRARYPDLGSLTNMQLLDHYAKFGRAEGRNPRGP